MIRRGDARHRRGDAPDPADSEEPAQAHLCLHLDLPRREYLALEALMRRAGQTVRRTTLEQSVYGVDDEIQSNSLDANISRLRRKLADAGASIEIHPVRGVGYLLRTTR